MPQRDVVPDVPALIVGTPVRQRVEHPAKRLGTIRRGAQNSSDTAHD
jgi:hypothetical protein